MTRPPTWAGYRAHTHARSTGTTVVLVEATEAGIDTDTGVRWMLVCDEHAGCCGWPTQATARSFMAHPEEWCEVCRG